MSSSSKKNKIEWLLFFFAPVLFFFIAYYPLINQPVRIGHQWDWGFPETEQGIFFTLEKNLSTWNSRFDGGKANLAQFELPFWILATLVSTLTSKPELAMIFIGHLVAFVTFSYAIKLSIPELTTKTTILTALIYSFSPYAFSRIIAGHLVLFLGYSILPLAYISAIKLGQKKIKTPLILIVLATILASLHPGSLVIFLTVFHISFLLKNRITKKNLLKLIICDLLIISINLYWLFPYFSLLRHQELKFRTEETIAQEVQRRNTSLDSVSQNIIKVISSTIRPGMDTEFIYAKSQLSKALILSSSLIFFYYLIYQFLNANKQKKQLYLPEFLALFIFLGVVAGSKTFFGAKAYLFLKEFLPFIYAGFSNPNRWLGAYYLFFSLCMAMSTTLFSAHSRSKSNLFSLAVSVLVLAYLHPWLNRDLYRPLTLDIDKIQALNLQSKSPAIEDAMITELLSQSDPDSRVVFLPPSLLSWPGSTNRIFSWNAFSSPKDSFFQASDLPITKTFSEIFYRRNLSPENIILVNALLDLAGVREIVYPEYPKFGSYLDKNPVENDYKPKFDQIISQLDLEKANIGLSHTQLLINKNPYPRVYLADKIITHSSWNESEITLIVESTRSAKLAVVTSDQRLPLSVSGESTKNISYEKVSPTSYKVTLTNLEKPELLVLSERYSSQWELNSKFTPPHFLVNGFANAWLIDPVKFCEQSPLNCDSNQSGRYVINLEINYLPQFYLQLGIISSIVSFLILGLIIKHYLYA